MRTMEIKHHKDFHKIQLQGLRIKERSIFMALCYKAMEQDDMLLEFDVEEIAKISGYTQQKGENIYKYLDTTYTSLQNATIKIDKTNGIKKFVLFIGFETFEDIGKVQFKVNEDYRYLLNQVIKPFTIQNMIEYRQLNSKYSQLMYSMLKEWEGVKKQKYTMKEFREKLGIPEKYRMTNIDQKVLKPIKEELSQYFYNLKIEKIKTIRSISHIEFSWSEKKITPKKEKHVPIQGLSLSLPIEEVKTSMMDTVRQCIKEHPHICNGHNDKKTDEMCQNMRKYIG